MKNNTNIYFSCFSLIRACVSSLFDNFFKVVAVCLIVCFVLSCPAAAFASTTESAIMFASGARSIPSGYNVTLSSITLNKDSNLWSQTDFINLVDNSASYYQTQDTLLAGNTGDRLVGFTLHFNPNIDGGFYSHHVIDLSAVEMRVLNNNYENQFFCLSPTAVPVYAYAEYDGTFSYQIYDGSVGYERWIYDNAFTLTKPIQINNTNFGQIYDDSSVGFDMFIKTPAISSSDILDITAYKNMIAETIAFEETEINNVEFVSIEDFPTENIRISNDMVSVYVLYAVDNATWEPYASWMGDIKIPDNLNGCMYQFIVNTSRYNNNLTSVNVNSIDYLDDQNSGLSFISNGFYSLKSSIGSSLSNVVTNATDNANRIIQNTTQKVDEVKQGVTAVKDSVVETKNSILDLPNKIKDMLLGLIIPSDEDIAGKYDEFSTLLEAKLGVIYQIPAMILELFQTLLSGVTDPQTTLTFPSLSLPWIDGTQMKLWDSIEFEIIPTGMDVLKELIQTVTSMVCVIMTFNSVKRIYENFLRGR